MNMDSDSEESMDMDKKKIAVVTGANKGIGYGIMQLLCEEFDGYAYLATRNRARGETTVEAIQQLGFVPMAHQMDIGDQESIDTCFLHIEREHHGINILVNNAGIYYKNTAKESLGEQAENTIRINYFGTLAVCHAFFPLLRPHGRVCHLSSSYGHLSQINGDEPAATQLRAKLASKTLTEEELGDLMKQFVAAAKDGTFKEKGWPSSPYTVSKVGVAALTRIQQRAFDADPREDLVVNCCHPGNVRTDMSSHEGNLTIQEGAVCPTYLALLPPNIKEPKGAYVWHDKTVVDWTGPMPAVFV